MLTVFLCHASQDKEKVRELYDKLNEDGLSPWLDEKSILPGQDWNFEIRNAIRTAHAVIVCLSNNSINKIGYIQKEIKFALDVADEQPDGSVFLIPVRLDECTVPQRLSHLQYADLFRNEYERLLQVLQIRASKLGIRITKRDRKSNSLSSLNKNTGEEERSELIGEQFNHAFVKLFLNGGSKLKLKSANKLTVSFMGARRVGKTAIIYTLAKEELSLLLSKTGFMTTGGRSIISIKGATSIGEEIYIRGLNVESGGEQNVYRNLNFADFVFYVISIDHPLTRLDRITINILKQKQIPYLVLINKTDILQVYHLNDYSGTIEDETESVCVCYSVLSSTNLELLKDFIRKARKRFTD